MGRLYACWIGLALLMPVSVPSHADIYRYIDSDGVLHFTNVPVSRGAEIYIRDRAPAPYGGVPKNESGRYDTYIDHASRTFGVDFSLLKAVIQVESGFDPLAVSRKGATGLMQIMPDNYRLLNIHNPFDPRQNIMGGARYLRMMLERFEDQLHLALAAYNAGPGMVEKYRRIPPFPETLQYVDKVMKQYQEYKQNDRKRKGYG